MLITTLVVTSIIRDYNRREKSENLFNVTHFLAEHLQDDYIDEGEIRFSDYLIKNKDYISRVIDVISVNANSFSLTVFTTEYRILYSGGKYEEGSSLARKPEKLTVEELDEIIEETVKQGKSSFITDLSGKLDRKMIFCAENIYSKEGSLRGYVISCTNTGGIGGLLSATIKTITVTTLSIMLAFFITVFFITDKLVSPIRELSRAAREFASGKLDARVVVRGNDEIAELEKAFNNMTSSLSENEEMRRLFLANVSHDLRTPMTTISGFIDGILDGAIPEDKRDYYLGIVASEVRRLSRLVSALLDITKIQAGERKFTKAPFDICEMCREIIISSVQRIENKKLSVNLETDEDNMYAVADRDAIYQILYNLIDNAIKFSFPDTEFSIYVKYEGKKILVTVFNYGEGIDPEDLPHVFDRFYKGDKSRGLDKTGTGLGLYIARTICEAHEEKIKADSEKGKWCRFTFTLDKGDNPKRKSETN